MLIAMLLVALLLGWWAERAREQRLAVEWIRRQPAGKVIYDFKRNPSEWVLIRLQTCSATW